MAADSILLWYPFVTVLGTLPLFCWYDWKYREIPDNAMGALFLLNIPFLIWAYMGGGGFGWEEAVTSLLPVVIYYVIMRVWNLFFHGDDFLYMGIVSMCCVVNPLISHDGAYPVKVMIYLGGVIVLVTALNFLKNVVVEWTEKGDSLEGPREVSLMNLINGFDRGFPMMFAFAPAMILALVI